MSKFDVVRASFPNFEVRTCVAVKSGWDFESRDMSAESDGSGIGVCVGYGAVFNSRTTIAGSFTEEVSPKAFNKTLADSPVFYSSLNHDIEGKLLRTSRSGGLRLSVDEVGLKYEIDLPDTTVGRDVKEMLRLGDLTGSSFLFQVVSDKWEEAKGDKKLPHRVVEEVRLIEVGPVFQPAYEDASAALVELEKNSVEVPEVEEEVEEVSEEAAPRRYYLL